LSGSGPTSRHGCANVPMASTHGVKLCQAHGGYNAGLATCPQCIDFRRMGDDVPAKEATHPNMVEYPVVLWRGRDRCVLAKVRVPIDLKPAEVEVITRILRAVAEADDKGAGTD
jgi:hypothetical protein